jgi:hypothetical protein
LRRNRFVFLGIRAQQGTNAFPVNAWIWGALDEPIPANDNELIERAGMMARGSESLRLNRRLIATASAMRGGKKQIFDCQ